MKTEEGRRNEETRTRNRKEEAGRIKEVSGRRVKIEMLRKDTAVK